MNKDESTFRRMAGISAITAALLILAASIVLSMAVDFNFDFLSAPGDLITASLDEGAVSLFHWGSILELFGIFLLLIPLTLYLWFWLKPHSPRWITLFTVLGLFSIVIGVIGAAIRATLWPTMMLAYPQAAEAQRLVLDMVFKAVTDFAFEGLYPIDLLLAGLWFLGVGLLLRAERLILGLTTAIMGIAHFAAGFGWLFQIDLLARLELLTLLVPLWLLWIGIVIYRRDEDEQQMPALDPTESAELQGI